MKIGSKVRVISVPEGLEDYPDLPTKSTFTKCVGREFVIAGFNDVGMAELSSVNGSVGETILIGHALPRELLGTRFTPKS